MNSENAENKRKSYQKPTLFQVPLRPDEAVLGNCKMGSVTGPAQADCTTPSTCNTSGS